ncbi:MAG: ACP S-malonyltransferase [Pseudomonadota bacterium]|nr:ACP S-malonyltransferase [Pseudomonadota bacterium]
MRVAFAFPGQGSQSIGMMAGYDAHPVVRATFDEASAVLAQDLWSLVTEGPEDELNRTVNTQPVMLTAGIATWRAWHESGGASPVLVAGHSLGEYTALVAAGALAFADALPLVRFRAQAMQEAVPAGVGAMAALLGLDDDAVAAACKEATAACPGQIVEPVNYNAPGQLVIAGHRGAVEHAIAAARSRGAKRAVLLPVSAPFHSSLLQPAAERLRDRLAGIELATPTIPVLHNVDVAEHPTASGMRDALARQAASPVRWADTVRCMAEQGITHVVECGPGKVLSGLTRRIAPGLTGLSLGDGAALASVRATLESARGGGS